jgi:ABC-type sulfate transport system permease component
LPDKASREFMPSYRPAFYAACAITAICLILAAWLAYYGPDPTPQSITRLLDALINIAIVGASAIFGLLGYKPNNKPPEQP